MQSSPFASVLASASESQLQREATCLGRLFNYRHDFAEWRLQVASLFRQPYVNSVSGNALISIPGERSNSKGSRTQFPSLRYVSPLNRGASHYQPHNGHSWLRTSTYGPGMVGHPEKCAHFEASVNTPPQRGLPDVANR